MQGWGVRGWFNSCFAHLGGAAVLKMRLGISLGKVLCHEIGWQFVAFLLKGAPQSKLVNINKMRVISTASTQRCSLPGASAQPQPLASAALQLSLLGALVL